MGIDHSEKVQYKTMPYHSRVWIYQANRYFSGKESEDIKKKSDLFVEQWTSHSQRMNACIEIFYNRFIVVMADETTAPASGCGIDKSVHFIKQLEKEYSVNLFDRMQVVYKKEGTLQSCNLSQFEQLIAEGKIDENTIVFNNLVSTRQEMETGWEVPLKQSWHKKLIQQ